MTVEPVLLPRTPADPARPPLPVIAAIVPVAAGVVMWLVSGSILALCFAFLGPLMIVGSFLDGIRRRRKERRRDEAETDAAWRRAEQEIEARREGEREARWTRHPDLLRCVLQPPLRDDHEIGPDTTLVVGTGEEPSTVRVSGGDGERARAARERAASLDAAPVVVPLGRGVCIRADPVLGDAVARALVAQLCLRFGPGRLSLTGTEGAAAGFAHARAVRRDAFILALGDVPDGIRADAAIRVLADGDPVPDGMTTVLEGSHPDAMTLRTREGVRTVRVECLSAAQLAKIAEESATAEPEQAVLPARLARGELQPPPADRVGAACIGRGLAGDVLVDLVADGPHAIVTGMTGVGKSELLITWITSLVAQHSPDELVLVLADFKGGTAFEPLRALPHVTAVLTDLDDGGADRGVRSLTAELRRRERVLAEAGVRDVEHADLPRLVIVVDEFAALLQEHPDLAAVFTDIAARGRALGMHLILGTQRATGVIRDALAANCPLRISLRVSDPADSRLVIGSDAAAEIEGGPGARGIACVRRPQDPEAQLVRIAMTDAADLRSVAMRWAGAPRPASPWLPALPDRAPLADLPSSEAGAVLGLADDPDRQAQPAVVLRSGDPRGIAVIGGPGAGKSSAIRALGAQFPDALRIPSDPEGGWDAVAGLAGGAPPGSVILGDDIDRLLAALPSEHAQACAEMLEAALRSHADGLVVLTASRASGPVGRVLEALPERMLLRTSTRTEHFAAGGETSTFRERPPGRGAFRGRETQIAWVDEPAMPAPEPPLPSWRPERELTGIVCGNPATVGAALARRLPDLEVRQVGRADGEAPTGARQVLIGDAEEWQRDWAALQRVRGAGEMLVAAEQPAALRVLLGIRELPPYARPHAGRVWSIRDGSRPARMLLPG